MIAAIRIHGRAKIKKDAEETLSRLRMRKKLVCVLIDEKDEIRKAMLQSVKDYIVYGEVDDSLLKEMIAKRGETLNGKKVPEKEADKILSEIKKDEWKIKKFFRLHPPVGGFKKSTKLAYPKGILGKNEDISKLIGRML